MKSIRLTPELFIAALGIVCIFFLAGYALYQKVDGVMFGSAMSAIGAIVGFIVKGHFLKGGP